MKVGKLTTVSKQKNANYHLREEADFNAVHGFVENFCKLFKLREKRRRIKMEIAEKEYTSSYPYMIGNIVFLAPQFFGNALF